jgi:hypothetical protein
MAKVGWDIAREQAVQSLYLVHHNGRQIAGMAAAQHGWTGMQQAGQRIGAQPSPGGGAGRKRGTLPQVGQTGAQQGQGGENGQGPAIQNRSAERGRQNRSGGESLTDGGGQTQHMPHQDRPSGLVAQTLFLPQPRPGGCLRRICLCHGGMD